MRDSDSNTKGPRRGSLAGFPGLWTVCICSAVFSLSITPSTALRPRDVSEPHASQPISVVVQADGPESSGHIRAGAIILQRDRSNISTVAVSSSGAVPVASIKASPAPVAPQKLVRRPLQSKWLVNSAGRNLLCFAFGLFTLLALLDWYRFWCLWSSSDACAPAGGAAALLASTGGHDQRIEVSADKAKAEETESLSKWSTVGLVALTSYRFYTGFLSATWLPYLLAMEGSDLYTENQSLFMGLAKLIYAFTILTNPLLGLMGDRVVSLSHGIGRRLFLRTGLITAGLGIFICVLADAYRNFYCFVFGILLWRVGEALNDVTTEALVPELVPQSQYAIASAAKSTSFLLGGVSACVALIFMTGYHYTWLYWAYALGMLIFAIPCQVLLHDDLPMIGKRARLRDPFDQLLRKAYVSPAFIAGYFPQFCLGIFVFSFGTSPMYFLMLMIRDLVGANDPVLLQDNFSTSCIIFFISAAVATVLGGISDKAHQLEQSAKINTGVMGIKEPRVLISRLQCIVKVGMAYAAVVMSMPMVCLLERHWMRTWAFYLCALLLGYSFGSGFARFQDITWQLIPAGTDVANAMGFNIMCRLFGVGVGNFIAGGLLEFFKVPEQKNMGAIHWYNRFDVDGLYVSSPVYQPLGYVAMCAACAIASLASSYIICDISKGVQRELDSTPVPAA